MSAENGKMYASTTKVTPETCGKMTNAIAADIKREPGSVLMSNGSSSFGTGEKSGITLIRAKLSSLKPARDLTLGGRGRALAAAANASSTTKKVYVPNLNVERRKNANVKSSKDITARGGRGTRGARGEHGGGRGSGRGRSALIQTQGVFSEGVGTINIRKTSSTGGSHGRSSDDTASAMRRPTLVKNELKKIDLKADATKVRDILGDSEDECDGWMDDKTDVEHIPIKLNEVKRESIKTEIKTETSFINGDVSSTDVDDESAALAVAHKMQAMAVQQHGKQHNEQQYALTGMPRYPESVQELLSSTHQQIFVIQLPDRLPCEDDEDDGNVSPEKSTDKSFQNEPATSAGAASISAHCNSPIKKSETRKAHSLKKMEEGQVGKLLRYKSGKIKLVLGATYFDLDMGMETGFLQDLMSISTNREERSGNMINLGPIQAKLTATPDWEQLLKQQQSQEPA